MSTTPNEQPVQTPSGIELKVCADIAARQRVGIAKYGMTLEQNPADLKERLTHAYQESLDLPLYLRWILEELDQINLYRAELEAVARAAALLENHTIARKDCKCAKCSIVNALESLRAKGWTPTGENQSLAGERDELNLYRLELDALARAVDNFANGNKTISINDAFVALKAKGWK